MNEQLQELAASQALRLLEGEESRQYEEIVVRDRELAALTADFEETVAALAATATPIKPPAHLKSALMSQIREKAAGQKSIPTPKTRHSPIAWGIAAALAAGSFWLWNERTTLATQVAAMTKVEAEARNELTTVKTERDTLDQKNTQSARQLAQLTTQLDGLLKDNKLTQEQVIALTSEITLLRKKDAFAQVQIATLQSTVASYKKGVAVVVWDSEKHQGVLKLEKMPPVDTGKDYQLWVVDPKNPAPVNAGIVQVDANGFAKVDFKPVEIVSEATKFALSVERKGGSVQNEGPIILIGP